MNSTDRCNTFIKHLGEVLSPKVFLAVHLTFSLSHQLIPQRTPEGGHHDCHILTAARIKVVQRKLTAKNPTPKHQQIRQHNGSTLVLFLNQSGNKHKKHPTALTYEKTPLGVNISLSS